MRFSQFNAPSPHVAKKVYRYLRTAIVAIHQLPRTQETLWLRLLGNGIQQQAIDELMALSEDHPQRAKTILFISKLENYFRSQSKYRATG